MNVREAVAAHIDDALFLDPPEMYDRCIIGIGERFGGVQCVAYDRDKCIEMLMKDMSWEDAEEYFSFNVIGAWVGDQTPIFVSKRGKL